MSSSSSACSRETLLSARSNKAVHSSRVLPAIISARTRSMWRRDSPRSSKLDAAMAMASLGAFGRHTWPEPTPRGASRSSASAAFTRFEAPSLDIRGLTDVAMKTYVSKNSAAIATMLARFRSKAALDAEMHALKTFGARSSISSLTNWARSAAE